MLVLRNSLAHLIARVAALAAGIATIPLVALTLGTEALGLIGIYTTLQAMIGLFDLGLPVTANHRLAVMIGRKVPAVEQSALVRTLEVPFWGLAVLFFIVGFGLRDSLAETWLNVSGLSSQTVTNALALMIGAATVRFPASFYANVMFAYDRHFYPNAVTTIAAIMRILVSLIALVMFNVGIVGFFVIQLAMSLIEVSLLVAGVWLARSHRFVAPRWMLLRDIGAMAGGLTLISVTAVILSQIDKIVVSKFLSLGDFGVYSAGYTLATGLVALSYPVGNAIFPRLSRSFDGKAAETKQIVLAATELNILILAPLGCATAMQAAPLLALLFLVKPLPDGLVAILPLMALGGLAQAFVTLPHLFQVAAGRVATVVWINVGFIVPYTAGVVVATSEFGLVGAAAAFIVFNVLRLLVHWIVLAANDTTRSVWLSPIGTTLAAVGGGLILAALPATIGITGIGAIFVAVLSVPALAVLASITMPISRARLLAIYKDGLPRSNISP